jgi:hypothetical protein
MSVSEENIASIFRVEMKVVDDYQRFREKITFIFMVHCFKWLRTFFGKQMKQYS